MSIVNISVAGEHLGSQRESEPMSPSRKLRSSFGVSMDSRKCVARDKKVLQDLLRTIAENIQTVSFQLQETLNKKLQLMQLVNALMQEEIALQERLKKESDKENVVKQQLQEIENKEKDLWKEEELSCEELDKSMQQNEHQDMRTECLKVEKPCCIKQSALTEKDGHHSLQRHKRKNDLVAKNIHTDTAAAKQIMDLKLFSGFVAIPIISSVQIVNLKLCSDENMTKLSDSNPGLLKDSTTNLTDSGGTTQADNLARLTDSVAEKTNGEECKSSDQSTRPLRSVEMASLGSPPIAVPVPRKYKCVFCEENFLDIRARKSHELTNHGTEFRCNVCDKVFPYRDYLASHKKIHADEKHDDQTMFADSLAEKTNDDEYKSSDKSTRPLCSVDADSLGLPPMPQSPIYICVFCGEHFRDARARQSHELTTHGTEFRCNVCDKVFVYREYLSSHKKIHADEKPFACTFCDRRFRTNVLMKRHLRHHTGEKHYACSVCSERFMNADKRRVHMSVHTGKQPYWCQKCGRAFSSNGCLTAHLRIHSGEKPYACDVCGKRFRNRYQIIVHKETHGEKPCVCYICGKRFGVSALKAHMRTHSGIKVYYQCAVCDKKLAKKSTLEMHTRIVHMGEAPYVCNICYKGFAKSKDCKLHKKEHDNCSSLGNGS